MVGIDEIKKNKLQELILFLMFTFVLLALPALFFCLDTCSFSLLAVITILRNIGLSFLVFLFLKLRGEPFSLIGWKKDNLGRNIFLGIVLFPLFYFSVGLVLDLFVYKVGFSPSPSHQVPKSLIESPIEGVIFHH